MMRRWGWLLGVLVLLLAPVLVASPTTAAPSGPDALRLDLDQILSDPRLDGAHAGVVVRDPETDEVLYNREGQARATPASNAKLFTSAAALDTLGPDYRFHTGVRTTAPQQGDALLGDVYLRGTGDPTMLAADYDRFAARIAGSGIHEIRGRLLADDSWFDDVPLGTGWAWDDEPYYYSAPVSALTVAPNTDYDAGSVIVRVSPGQQGQHPRVDLHPGTDVVTVDNQATTTAPGTEPRLSVGRAHGTNRMVISGSVPADAQPTEEFMSVPDPSAYAADVFRRALARHGVRVGATGSGVTPPGARELAGRDSMPLRELLVPFLKLSNNGHAEVLVKAMGREARGHGTWADGVAVVASKLKDLGVDPRTLRLVDGSGLSAMDGVTPDQITTLLDHTRQRSWFREWYNALPIAGKPQRMVGGTLDDRMRGTPAEGNVHAKTGSLTGVSSLSGYVTAADGRKLVFSILFNDYLSAEPTDLQDAVAIRLAKYNGAEDNRQPAPRIPEPRTTADDPATPIDESALECSWIKRC